MGFCLPFCALLLRDGLLYKINDFVRAEIFLVGDILKDFHFRILKQRESFSCREGLKTLSPADPMI